jgi:hypothetical protein
MQVPAFGCPVCTRCVGWFTAQETDVMSKLAANAPLSPSLAAMFLMVSAPGSGAPQPS